MEILVCVKRVPAPGAVAGIAADGRHLETDHLAFTVGPHEECAVEEAIRIVADHGGSVTVLTVGPEAAEEQLRAALAVGADHAVRVDGDDDLEPQVTATAIAHALDVLGAEGRRFDLLLFGNESADAGHYQVGIRVACGSGLPMVGGVKGLEVSSGGDRLRLRRDAATGAEVYEVDLPAAVAVREGLNLPRYPSMRGRLRAMRAPVTTITADWGPTVTGGLRTVRLRQPDIATPQTVMLGHGAAAAPAVVDVLQDLGVV